MIKIFLRNYGKIFLLLLSIFIVSCAKKDEGAPAFRIVGLNGEQRQLQTRMPELNARIIQSQGGSTSTTEAYSSQMSSQQMAAGQQYEVASIPDSQTNALQNTLQSEQGKPVYNVAKNEAEQAAGIKDKVSDSVTSVGATEQEQEIEYDLSEPEKPTKSSKKMRLKVGKSSSNSETKVAHEEVSTAKEEVAKNTNLKGRFVQTGSFSDQENAKHQLAKMKKFSTGSIEEGKSGDKTVYRVLLGPFASDKKAKDMVNKIKASGHDAIIVKHK